MRCRAVALSALAAAGCGGPATPVVPRRPVPAPAPAAAVAAARSSAPTSTPARAACPLPDKARRDRQGSIAVHGRWLVESVDGDDTRILELLPDRAVLRVVIAAPAPDAVEMLGHDRVAVELEHDLVIVDLATGALHDEPGRRLVAEARDFVLVGDDGGVVRLGQGDLSPAGQVAIGACDAVGGRAARALRDGAAFEVRGALVAFDGGAAAPAPGRVLRQCASFGGASSDESHVLACDPRTSHMEIVDTTSGATGASFALRDVACEGDGAGLQTAGAYAPDPRYVFWFERGAPARGYDTSVVVAVGDTRTGKVQRLRDTRATWSVAFDASAELGPDGRLCGRFRGFHSSFRQCDWRLAPGGRARRDPVPKPAATPSLAALGLSGAIEITRTTSPAGDRTVVLSYRKHGDDQSDLRVAVIAKGKLERSVALQPGPIAFDDQTVGVDYDPAPGTFQPPPDVVFADATHAVVLPGVGNLTMYDVDVTTGTFTTPCKGSESCSQSGRYVLVDGGKLQDLASGRRVTLDSTPDAWGAAIHVPACP